MHEGRGGLIVVVDVREVVSVCVVCVRDLVWSSKSKALTFGLLRLLKDWNAGTAHDLVAASLVATGPHFPPPLRLLLMKSTLWLPN